MAASTASLPSQHIHPNNNEDERYPDHYKGVKALVDVGIHAIPDIYIRPLEQRPVLLDSHQHEDELPLIDLAYLQGDVGGRGAVVEAIGQACRQWGFFSGEESWRSGVRHGRNDESGARVFLLADGGEDALLLYGPQMSDALCHQFQC